MTGICWAIPARVKLPLLKGRFIPANSPVGTLLLKELFSNPENFINNQYLQIRESGQLNLKLTGWGNQEENAFNKRSGTRPFHDHTVRQFQTD